MILVQHKKDVIARLGACTDIVIRDKILTGTVTFKGIEENEEDVVFKIPEKDLSNVENSIFILLGDRGRDSVELIDGYRFTESFRDRFYYLRLMFDRSILLIFKVSKKTEDAEDLNLLIECSHVAKENFTLDTTLEVVEEEFLPTIDGCLLSKYDRRKFFPCYALVLDGQEFHADDDGKQLNDTDTEVTYTGNRIDLCIKKYDYGFNKPMNESDDVDKVYIETTCGIVNSRMTYLENGEKHLVFHPMDYEGKVTIKIGWRWNPVVNQYNIVLKKIEG